MALKLVTPPAAEPLSISDVEAQLQFSLPEDQVSLVEGFIVAVRQKAETALRRALVTQEWDMVLDAFPGPSQRNQHAALEIPLPPLQSITSIQYLGYTSGQLQTLDAADYTVDTDSTPGRVMPVYGKVWPVTLDYPGAVRVRFVAGYGDAADVPQCVKQWILLNVAALYENREAQTGVVGNSTMLDFSIMADALLDPERWEVRV